MRTVLTFVLTMMLSVPVAAGAQGEQQSTADIAAPASTPATGVGKIVLVCVAKPTHAIVKGNRIEVSKLDVVLDNEEATLEVPVGEKEVALMFGKNELRSEKYVVRSDQPAKADLCAMKHAVEAKPIVIPKDPKAAPEKPLPYWALGALAGAPGIFLAFGAVMTGIVYGIVAYAMWYGADQKAASDGLTAKSSYRTGGVMAMQRDMFVGVAIAFAGLAVSLIAAAVASVAGIVIGYGAQETIIGMNQKEPPGVPGPNGELPPATPPSEDPAVVPQPVAKK